VNLPEYELMEKQEIHIAPPGHSPAEYELMEKQEIHTPPPGHSPAKESKVLCTL